MVSDLSTISVKVTKRTKKLLESSKLVPSESLNSVIERALKVLNSKK